MAPGTWRGHVLKRRWWNSFKTKGETFLPMAWTVRGEEESNIASRLQRSAGDTQGMESKRKDRNMFQLE